MRCLVLIRSSSEQVLVTGYALLEGEPAQMGFKSSSSICGDDNGRVCTQAGLMIFSKADMSNVGWHRYLGMLELTRALRYTWHSHTNLIPGLTFMLAVSFRDGRHAH